jgi:hypothetical protein
MEVKLFGIRVVVNFEICQPCDLTTTIFSDSDAEERALEYFTWKSQSARIAA